VDLARDRLGEESLKPIAGGAVLGADEFRDLGGGLAGRPGTIRSGE